MYSFGSLQEPPGSYDILTSGQWKITALTSITTISGLKFTEDELAGKQECEKDNLLLFGKNGQITVDEGVSKCYPNDPQTSNGGAFILVGNDTTLVEFKNGYSYAFRISELSQSTLKMSYDTTYSSGTSVSSFYTLMHQ